MMRNLYKKNSSGKTMVWGIRVEESDRGGLIVIEHGQLGGKLQRTNDLISKGKNLGKSNATTPLEQALLEMESKIRKQVERKGYVMDIEALNMGDQREGAEAMLAHRYDKHSDKIKYPAMVQPKLDGHRCLAVIKGGKCRLFSRQRKEINSLPHIVRDLEDLSKTINQPDIIFDGELYNHDFKSNFEELTGYIRSKEPKVGCGVVEYHMYDTVSEVDCIQRSFALSKLEGLYDSLVIVETVLVDTEESALSEFELFIERGYEGAILRNRLGPYEGKRSYNLQKVKTFIDAEFEIVGVEEGRGKMKGHAIFVCETSTLKSTFRAKMKGSMSLLSDIFQNKESYIGKNLTVMFQEYTKDGIPRFPIGIRVREDV